MRRLLLILALFLGAATPVLGAELNAGAAEIDAVLSAARPGDVIRLRGGGWAEQTWRNVVKAAPGVVVRAEAARNFSSLTVMRSEGLTVRGLKVRATGPQAIQVSNAKQVTIEGCDVTGDRQITDGVWVRLSEDVTLRGCRFHDLRRGVFHEVNQRITVEDSDFRRIWGDALRGGRDSDGVTLRRLTITDLHVVGGDHLDAIQFWTTNATTPTRRVLIEDVVYRRGDGDAAQGVFIGNELNLPYENVVVRRVAAVGGLYNGISLSGVIGGVVEDCFVQAMEGAADAKGRAVDRVWIQFRGSTGGISRDNVATLFQVNQNLSDPSNERFRAGKVAKKDDYSELDAWLAKAGVKRPAGL